MDSGSPLFVCVSQMFCYQQQKASLTAFPLVELVLVVKHQDLQTGGRACMEGRGQRNVVCSYRALTLGSSHF